MRVYEKGERGIWRELAGYIFPGGGIRARGKPRDDAFTGPDAYTVDGPRPHLESGEGE